MVEKLAGCHLVFSEETFSLLAGGAEALLASAILFFGRTAGYPIIKKRLPVRAAFKISLASFRYAYARSDLTKFYAYVMT